jgi:hypothetical protein
LVATWIILPLESLRTIARTKKSLSTATSKLALKLPRREGDEMELKVASFQATLCAFTELEIWSRLGWIWSCTSQFLINQIWSIVIATWIWKSLVSTFGIDKRGEGLRITITHSAIGILLKTSELKGQGEILHKILAKEQSRKMWDIVSRVALQKGQNQSA